MLDEWGRPFVHIGGTRLFVNAIEFIVLVQYCESITFKIKSTSWHTKWRTITYNIAGIPCDIITGTTIGFAIHTNTVSSITESTMGEGLWDGLSIHSIISGSVCCNIILFLQWRSHSTSETKMAYCLLSSESKFLYSNPSIRKFQKIKFNVPLYFM